MTWYHTANMVVSSTFYVLVSTVKSESIICQTIPLKLNDFWTEILLFLKAGVTWPLHSVKAW